MVASFCIQLPPNVSNCTGISNSTWQKWNRFFPPKPDLPLYLGHTIIHQIAQTKTAKSSWILLFFLPSPPYPSVMSALPLNLSLICLLFYSSTFYSCHPSMSHYPFLLDHYISFLTSSCFLSCPLHQDFSFSHYWHFRLTLLVCVCGGGGCLVNWKMFGSIPGLQLLEASTKSSPTLQMWQMKLSLDISRG